MISHKTVCQPGNSALKRPQAGIVLTALVSLCCIYSTGTAYGQKTIRGTVRDAETDEGLPVAHIREAGTRNGTVSNETGDYIIELKSVPATVLVTYIGYASERLEITIESPEEQDVSLTPSPIILETVVVTDGDMGNRVMEKVIRKKQEWWPNLSTFIADAYTRVNLANEKEIIIIGESMSDVYWDVKRGVREIEQAKRQTKNTKMKDSFANARMTPNLYQDDINILGFKVIGPTHPKALKYYDFKIIERRYMDDKLVYVMSMTPKSKLQPCLVGTISVLDVDYAVIDLDVKPNEAIMFPPPLNRFKFAVKQQFSNFGQDYWLPVDVLVSGELKLKLPGIEFPAFRYKQFTRFADYQVNAALPDSLFGGKREFIRVAVSSDSVSVSAVKVSDEKQVAGDESEKATAAPPVASAPSNSAIIEEDETMADAAETVEATAVTPEPPVQDDSAETAADEPPENEALPPVAPAQPVAEGSVPDIQTDPVPARADSTVLNAVVVGADSLFEREGRIVPFTEEEKKAYSAIDSTKKVEDAFMPKGAIVRLMKIGKKKEKKDRKPKKEPSAFRKAVSKALDPIEPKFHHNRVDAYHLGASYGRKIGKRFDWELEEGFKTGPQRWTYGGKAEYRWGEKQRNTFEVSALTGTEPRFRTDHYPVWLNSVETLFGGNDYYDFYRNDRVRAAFSRNLSERKHIDITAGVNLEHHESLAKTSDETVSGRIVIQRENPPVKRGQLRALDIAAYFGRRHSALAVEGGKGAEFMMEHSSGAFDSDFTFTRVHCAVEWRFNTFFRRRLFPMTIDVRVVGGGSTGTLPVQRFGSLDGSFLGFTPFGSFRSLWNRPLEGEHYCAVFAEHNFRTLPFELLGLRFLARRNVGIILHGASGRTWISQDRLKGFGYEPRYRDGFLNEIGLSLNGIFTLFRIDVTKRLDNGDFTVGANISRII